MSESQSPSCHETTDPNVQSLINQRLTFRTAALLTLPPLLWAGNAVTGRMLSGVVPPVTLNLLRWARLPDPAAAGGLGAAARQRLVAALEALRSARPAWRGLELESLLRVRLVPGDFYILLATAAWALYSWLLVHPSDSSAIRGNWAAFLMAQAVPGLGWSLLFAAGGWAGGDTQIGWGWPLAAALAHVAIGPSILAYRSWGPGVQRVGPIIAGFFSNLTPLFAALLSAAFLGEPPYLYHALAFALMSAALWCPRGAEGSRRRGT